MIVSITAKARCNTGVAMLSAGNDMASTTQLDPPSGTDFGVIRMEGADAAVVDAHTNFMNHTAFHVLPDSMSCPSTWTSTPRSHRIATIAAVNLIVRCATNHTAGDRACTPAWPWRSIVRTDSTLPQSAQPAAPVLASLPRCPVGLAVIALFGK